MKILRTKKFYIIVSTTLIVAIFVYSRYAAKPAIEYNTAKVEFGTLEQTVSETGVIKQASEANLNFLAQGRLATTSVKVGAKVKRGQKLAELDYTGLKIQARQAEANLEVAKANLKKTLNGATIQDVRISQSAVSQAEAALANAKKDLLKASDSDIATQSQAQKNYDDLTDSRVNTPAEAAVNSALVSLAKNKVTYQKVINNRQDSLLVAVHDKNSVAKNALDNTNRILTDDDAKDTLSVKNTAKLQIAKTDYEQALSLGNPANLAYLTAVQTKSLDDILSASAATNDYLTKSIVALNDTFEVLERSVVSSKFTQGELDAFKATISSQISLANAGLSALEQSRQALSDAINNYDSIISNAEESLNVAKTNLGAAQLAGLNALNNAKLATSRNFQSGQSRVDAAETALELAQAQFGKTTANARTEDIALTQAQVKQAQANLDGVLHQINNSIIYAPFDGQITQANYEIGEEPSAAKPVFIIMGEKQFEVEVDIAESDITKVGVGNLVVLDFDAFGEGIKFNGRLDLLDPAQTVIQEVVYYKGFVRNITASTTDDGFLKKIKPGMTANITIMANKKEDALIIPFRAVTDNSGLRTVKVLRNGQPVETPVSLGLRGDNGLVEVVSGLTVGQEIILSTKTD